MCFDPIVDHALNPLASTCSVFFCLVLKPFGPGSLLTTQGRA